MLALCRVSCAAGEQKMNLMAAIMERSDCSKMLMMLNEKAMTEQVSCGEEFSAYQTGLYHTIPERLYCQRPQTTQCELMNINIDAQTRASSCDRLEIRRGTERPQPKISLDHSETDQPCSSSLTHELQQSPPLVSLPEPTNRCSPIQGRGIRCE